MIHIIRPQTDPYFNLAAEEYVLKNYTADVLMLWQSKSSVVIGKHQNTLNEINHRFVEANNIPVIRRISGGGTVYHDLNNINYTLIRTGERKDRLINFREFLKPVSDFLATLGIIAVFEGKNNLRVEGKKISGNSAHVYKQRVLHHGTLLFNTDISILEKSISPSGLTIEDKAVHSVRSEVTNIAAHLKRGITIDEFVASLEAYLLNYYKIEEMASLTSTDRQSIKNLVKEKYGTWQWNFGYSPVYTLSNHSADEQVTLEVKNGLIAKARFQSELATGLKLADRLIGLPHREAEIMHLLNEKFDDQNKITMYADLLGF